MKTCLWIQPHVVITFMVIFRSLSSLDIKFLPYFTSEMVLWFSEMLLNQQTWNTGSKTMNWIKSKQTEAKTVEDTGKYPLHNISFPEKNNLENKLFAVYTNHIPHHMKIWIPTFNILPIKTRSSNLCHCDEFLFFFLPKSPFFQFHYFWEYIS